MNRKLQLLLTNDDGIQAPGLYHLWRGVKDWADVVIVAPSEQQSGKGLSITIFHPIHTAEVSWEEEVKAYQVNGTPADCVKLALSALGYTPDLILSGINAGENTGRNVLYSGTVGAVIEGTLKGIPGIGFSLSSVSCKEFDWIIPHIRPIVEHTLEHPLPPGSLLNVNFPSTSDSFRGYRYARQGRSFHREDPTSQLDPHGRQYHWMGVQFLDEEEHPESDVKLVKEGFITAAPLHVADLTDLQHFEEKAKHFENLHRGEKGNS